MYHYNLLDFCVWDYYFKQTGWLTVKYTIWFQLRTEAAFLMKRLQSAAEKGYFEMQIAPHIVNQAYC